MAALFGPYETVTPWSARGGTTSAGSGFGAIVDVVSVPFRPPVPQWDFLPVPAIEPRRSWALAGLRELCTVRRAVRRYLADAGDDEAAVEQAILIIDELASNAIRHGSQPAVLVLCEHRDGWLVVATDAAPDRLPIPAVDRPAERGGMGLYVVADLSNLHGVQCERAKKHVWAVVPRA